MSESGNLVSNLEEASFGMQMEISMMENGKLTLLMDMALMFTKMVQRMKECGRKINKRALEKTPGLMEQNTRDII